MDINDPEQWKHTHWIQSGSSFYFKRSNKKTKKNLPKLVSIRSNLKGLSKNQSECYLCGLEMTKKTNEYGGILTDTNLCMVAGLPYNIYEESMVSVFKLLKKGDISDKYKQLYKTYKEFQRRIWKNNYYSIHKECLKKRDLKEFLLIDFKLQLMDPHAMDMNVKKLLSELFYPDNTRKRSSKKNNKYNISRDDLKTHIVTQYDTIKFNINRLYTILSSYKQLFNYSFISITISLTMFIHLFETVPFSLYELIEKMNIDNETIVFYTTKNLPTSEIKSLCSEFYSFKKEDVLDDFCIFFRSYVNLLNTLKYCALGITDDSVYIQFRLDIINVSNYIWNIWSLKYTMEEAIVSGDRSSVSSLYLGGKLDSWATQYDKWIYYQEIVESIGKKMSYKQIKKIDKQQIVIDEQQTSKGLYEPNSGESDTYDEDSEEDSDEGSDTSIDTNEGNDIDASIDKLMVKELKQMKFTIDGKELVF